MASFVCRCVWANEISRFFCTEISDLCTFYRRVIECIILYKVVEHIYLCKFSKSPEEWLCIQITPCLS